MEANEIQKQHKEFLGVGEEGNFKLPSQGGETFALKSLSKESEKEKLIKFWNSIKAIFPKKIRETLL